ncbi:hypothetical protein I1A62_03400 (plasmid) [Rhodococcus sp. USK10]|uniref:hypothetical protein n=1 Tax=Rhodococcus sp. USK10 TaxID=2789739 RepID=UPI001C5CF0E9|nr:hypothetical protein [Rhodococcus sp. USK10]QYB00145.1 hypothetical protein I1A62_03400 [Rhodococcus sp. USK10]
MTPDRTATLIDAEETSTFSVHALDMPLDDVAEILARTESGYLAGEYAWISRTFVEERAPSCAVWRRRYEDMLQYAHKHGYLSPDNTHIRAHLEFHGHR